MLNKRVAWAGMVATSIGFLLGGCLTQNENRSGDGRTSATQAMTSTGPARTTATTPATQATMQLGWHRDGKGNLVIRAAMRTGEVQEHKTRIVEDLTGFSAGEVERDQYGGWKGEDFGATGFFHAKKIGERWWLVDPEGNKYLHIALNSVGPGKGPQAKAAFAAKFGTLQNWREKTLAMLRENGFTGTGAWSDNQADANGTPRMVYTPIVYFVGNYTRKIGWTVPEGGHIAYKNKCMPIFDPAFADFCDESAKQFAKTKDDPWLLGYFSDNELPMPSDSLDRFLSLGDANTGGKAAKEFLTQRQKARGDDKITTEDRTAWQALVADRYYSTVSKAIRKYDPNHMYLGSRLWNEEKWSPEIWAAAGKYADVVSVNVYSLWDVGWPAELKWAKWAGKPVITTEWYAKGQDTGMPNATGSGWTVATQQERGWFYENFTLSLLESRGCVGWNWFMYQDNDPTDPQAEKSNRNSNKGVVNIRFEPYTPLLESMKRVNTQAYELAAWFEKERAEKDASGKK